MFGHRGLWHDGWKAVAFHPPGTPYDDDPWELFHLDEDFSETNDLAARHPEKLERMIALWWEQAVKCNVLPLDDRFRERFATNATHFHRSRKTYMFHAGMGHLPTEVAPDVRSRNYLIEADVHVTENCEGVLIAHGDATTGYSLYLQEGHLLHDMNIGGEHVIVKSKLPVSRGDHRLGIRVRRFGRERSESAEIHQLISEFTLLIDGVPAGSAKSRLGFFNFISWTGLDIGRDRGSPVSHYEAPFAFTGRLTKVIVTMDEDQKISAPLGALNCARTRETQGRAV